jgi:hypothetical protein
MNVSYTKRAESKILQVTDEPNGTAVSDRLDRHRTPVLGANAGKKKPYFISGPHKHIINSWN